MSFKEKTIRSELVYKGPVFNVRKHIVEARGGEAVRDVVEHVGGAIMVAVTPEGKVLMERQFRKPLEKEFLELPAGKADPNEDPIVTATRELKEETGYTAGNVRYLCRFYPSVGFSEEVLYLYLCTDLTEGETDFDENEALDIEKWDIDELHEMVMRGEIDDAKTLIAIEYAHSLC